MRAGAPSLTQPSNPLGLLLALLVFVSPGLCGFTGDVGVEAEFYAGVGLGEVATSFDIDNYGELGLTGRYKFRHFPYDDLSAWAQFGGSWTTFPTGGDFGNQVVTIQAMGGIIRHWGILGAGLALFGDSSGVGPMLVLPSIRIRIGEHDRIQFGFGMMDEAPYLSGGGPLHWEGIFAVPWDRIWAPRLKIGARLNLYAIEEHFPLELYGGAEARLGRHIRVAIEGTLGDGGSFGDRPTFSFVAKVGAAVGKGTKSERKPRPYND